MKTSLRITSLLFGALVAIASFFGFAPNTAQASTTTTLLAVQPFTSTYLPSGWTDNSGGGWYYNSIGNGGSNGSAMLHFYYCYGGGLQTPTVDASAYSQAGDTAFVEFDMYWELDYWGYDNMYIRAYNSSGNTNLLSGNTNSYYTWNSNSTGDNTTPQSSSSYWKHYKLGIPTAYRTSSLKIEWYGSAYYCAGNFGIDNVTIYGTHYNLITATPGSGTIDYGSINVGDTGKRSVVISNPNPIAITISNVLLSSAGSDFWIARMPTVIPAGTAIKPALDSVTVYCSPTSGGVRTNQINFSTNADGPTAVSVGLRANGLAPVLSQNGVTQLFFRVRTKIGATRTASFLVTNTGVGKLNILSTTNISGDYPGEYSIVRLPSVGIGPGLSDTITISYHPSIEGQRPAVLNILSSIGPGIPINLAGIGILPRLLITPQSLAFGTAPVGVKDTMWLKYSNPGSDTVTLTRNYLSSGDADFTYLPVTGTDQTIAPDQFKMAAVVFTPVRTGSRQARIRITTNIPMTYDVPARDTSSFYVDITGTGVQFGKLAATGSLSDSTIVGTQQCNSDTLWNLGAVDLTVTSIGLAGTDVSDFSYSGITLPALIPAGGMRVISVCFKPSARGIRQATVTVTGTTNGTTQTLTLPLAGYGLNVCASRDNAMIFDKDLPIVNSSAKGSVTGTVTVTNCGDLPTTYTVAMAHGAASGYSVSPTTSPMVAAGATTTFTFTFAPKARGAMMDTATITGGPGVSQMLVVLSGTGFNADITATGTTAPTVSKGQNKNFDVTVTNAGNVDFVPGTPTITPSTDFTFVSGGTVAKNGGTGTMTFKFTPSAVGTSTATVTFPSQTPDMNMASFTISGIGAASGGVALVTEQNGFRLEQNYPNPAASATQIQFVAPQPAMVTISVIDMTGKIVATVASEHFSAGTHAVSFDASSLASGTYFFALTSGDVRLMRQMTIAK